MTNTKTTKRALITSVMALIVCFAMLLGTTYAWFTDSVTSANNIIQSGSLKIDLLHEDVSIKDDPKHLIFDYANWEPGYTQVETLTIVNKGTLALKYKLNLEAPDQEVTDNKEKLSDVIDVYVAEGAQTVTNFADIIAENSVWEAVGTLTDVLDMDAAISGNLLPEGEEATADAAVKERTFTIALHMQESAGNEYQNLSLGNVSIKLLATQYTYEEDAFDNTYDDDANLDFYPVDSFDELKKALANKKENITLTADILAPEALTVDYAVTINGAGHTISRGVVESDDATVNGTPYTGAMFTVKTGAELTLDNITVDGGAVWTGEINTHLQRGTVNTGITATGAIVATEGNGAIVLNEGAVLQNNDGANAVFLNTRTGSTLTINGGEIINNHSAAGAIWGGGAITMNSGKINGNHGGIGGAIRVVTNVGTVLTMNGGEMNYNLSDGNGGAIWAGSSRSNNVYVLNGGEMAYNYSAAAGGAIYAGYYETVKIGGTFKMHDNSAPTAGAIRFHNHASLVMTGGEIYDNGDNSLFLLNNSASITGGTISDNFGYGGGLGLTIGAADIDGVIAYDLSTNHNTAYLAAEFNGFSFTVNEADEHFANFNFKPADGYTYTEGDEDKLVCLNEGYETYWDTATGTFRLQAVSNP